MAIQNPVSPFILKQFPSFYEEYGPDFILFVESYYEWLESTGQALEASRSFSDWTDIDGTVDSFLDHFKNEYLAGIPYETAVDRKFLIKHIQDIYKVKGTPRALELLFKLFFGEDIEIYYPKEDILKASDGEWVVPVYLELSHNDRSANFEGRVIRGSVSDATAFVDRVSRKRVGTKIVDVCFISDLQGYFKYGEQVAEDDNYATAPYVTGSITSIEIAAGGINQTVGTLLNVLGSGVDGLVRVSEVQNGTGQATFTLKDGGTGYTLGSPTTVYISNNVLTVANVSGPFFLMDHLVQPLNNVAYQSLKGTYANGAVDPGVWSSNTTLLSSGYPVGQTIFGYDSANNLVANGIVMAQTTGNTSGTGTLVINVSANSFSNAVSLRLANNVANAVVTSIANASVTSVVVGSNSVAVGVCNIVGGSFYSNAYVIDTFSNTSAYVVSVAGGNNASFQVGSIVNPQPLQLFTDMIGGNNAQNVPYLNLYISGNNSLEANNGYGFPQAPLGGLDTPLSFVLASNTYQVGTIGSLAKVNPGSGYTKDPFVLVYNPLTVGYASQDFFYTFSTLSGAFLQGEEVRSSYVLPTQQVAFTGITGNTAFANGEGVLQVGSTSISGQVIAANSSTLVIQNISGSFTNTTSTQFHGLLSNATANVVSAVNLFNNVSQVTGTVLLANTAGIEARSMQPFPIGGTLVGLTSGANATISSENVILDGEGSMGENAIVSPYVISGNGVVTSVDLISSGFGYLQGEEVTLQGANSNIVLTGQVVLNKQGVGEGYYDSTRGFLDSDKFLHDNDYYQEFSYEIRSGLPLERYSTLLKNTFHVAGAKLFGAVEKSAYLLAPASRVDSGVVIGPLHYDPMYLGNLTSSTTFGTIAVLNTTYYPLFAKGIASTNAFGNITNKLHLTDSFNNMGIPSATTFGTLLI